MLDCSIRVFVMPFIEDMHLHNLSIFETLDGRSIIYNPTQGTSRILKGMLQEYSEIINGENIDLVSSKPVVSVRTNDIPEIQVGDLFQVDSQDYEVQVIRPDNEGITELILEKL